MGVEDFYTSWGWLKKLKERHSLTNHYLSGESTAIPDSTNTEWIRDLPRLIRNFNVKNIFDCDEKSLFYHLLPKQQQQPAGF